MIVYRFSDSRIFIINEYWVLIPCMVIFDLFLLRQIHKNKLRSLRAEKLRKISNWAMRSKTFRGGDDFIDVSYIQCHIEEGLSYLDDQRLRRIVHTLFKNKMKRKVIHITATALCLLVRKYNSDFLALPFVAGDFGLTNMSQVIRKVITTVFFGIVIPFIYSGGVIGYLGGAMSFIVGMKLGLTNLDKIIPVTSILGASSLKSINPRIPDFFDVVVINNKNHISMSSTQKISTWLPDQRLFNADCKIKPTQIPTVVDLLANDLSYHDVVNMNDVTGLERVKFTDFLDMGKRTKLPRRKAKLVRFLDKFGDSDPVDNMNTWDTIEPTTALERLALSLL